METLNKDKNSVLDYLTLQKTILSLVSDCNFVGNVQWLHFSHSKLLAWAGNCLNISKISQKSYWWKITGI